MKKSYLILAILVLVVAGAYVSLSGSQPAEPQTTTDTAEAQETAASGTNARAGGGANVLTGMYGLADVAWSFTETKPADGVNAPLVAVRIQPLGVTRPDGRAIEVSTWRVGQQQGSCGKIDKPADEQISAMSYVQCWWAGGGNQFRAVRDGNHLRVDTRGVDESESVPATWKQVLVIDLASIVN